MRRRIAAGAALAVGAALALSACTASASNSPSSLVISTRELPRGAQAHLTLTGPSGTRPVTVGTYSVAPGTYTLTAQGVPSGTNMFYPQNLTTSFVLESGQTTHETVAYPEVVPSTTKILSSGDLAGATVGPDPATGASTLSFPTGSATLISLSPGDVIVSGITPTTPQGLLVQVTAVHGNQVSTVPATLPQAVHQANFSVRVPAPIPSTTAYVYPAHSNPQLAVELQDGFNDSWDWNPTYTPAQGGSCTANVGSTTTTSTTTNPNTTTTKPPGAVQLTVNPHIHFVWGAYIDISANWDWAFGIPPVHNLDVKATAGMNESFLGQLTASLQGACTINGQSPSRGLGTYDFQIGPVPVTVTPSIQFVGDLKTTATLTATFGVTQSMVLQGTAEYNQNSGFHFTGSRNLTSSVNHSASLNGDSKLEAGPQLTIGFYGGVASFNLGVEGYLEGKASAATNAACSDELDIGLEANMGANLSIWDWNQSASWPNVLGWGPQKIWSASCTTPPPTSPTTTTTSSMPPPPSMCGSNALIALETAQASKTYPSNEFTVTVLKTIGSNPEWASFDITPTPGFIDTVQGAVGVAECTQSSGWQTKDLGGAFVGCNVVPPSVLSQLGPGFGCPPPTTTSPPTTPPSTTPAIGCSSSASDVQSAVSSLFTVTSVQVSTSDPNYAMFQVAPAPSTPGYEQGGTGIVNCQADSGSWVQVDIVGDPPPQGFGCSDNLPPGVLSDFNLSC